MHLGVMRKQEIRHCTSIASNFRAACRARSERERFADLCIVVEDADETTFWLERLVDAEFIGIELVEKLINEATEILKVMSAFKKHLEPKRDF